MDSPSNNFEFQSNQYTFQYFPQSSSEEINNSLAFVLKQRQEDQRFLTQWDLILKQRAHKTPTNNTKQNKISTATQQLRNLLGMIDNLKDFETLLRESYHILTEQEWSDSQTFVKNERESIDSILLNYSDCISDLKKLILKRNSKRNRIKRKNALNKKMYAAILIERAKKSQAIDERLQKIKDDIDKIKEEEEIAKISNITLKEVLSKKSDAKKNIALLESLVALRKARINTAKGRGEIESQSDTMLFTKNIGKLISIWKKALDKYSEEVLILRATMDEAYKRKLVGQDQTRKQSSGREVKGWCKALFGREDVKPQRDFQCNLGHFIAVRTQWDQFLDIDGSSLPSGWILPVSSVTAENHDNDLQ